MRFFSLAGSGPVLGIIIVFCAGDAPCALIHLGLLSAAIKSSIE